MKKTDRQKDYPFIGELARKMPDPRDRLLYSRSAEDLIELAREHPALVPALVAERPLLARIGADRRALAEALQLEMLDLIEVTARRIASYRAAMSKWEAFWPTLSREVESLTLREAHARIVERAAGVLPERVAG